MNITWKDVISASKISEFGAGSKLSDVCDWVFYNTNFKYLCFNGLVYEVSVKNHYVLTNFVLDYETDQFYYKISGE